MKEALFYKKGDNNQVYCVLCPHYCKIPDGELGKCRARKNQQGKLYSLNYGKLTSYAYDPIEKKPLYHFYPGSNIFSIGTFGCNLACDFCQNWQIVYDGSLAMDISDKDILTLAKAKDSIGIAYTYNEPSIWYEYIMHISKKIRAQGLKNIIITNGFINEKPLKKLLPYIDAMNIDLKSIEDSFYKSYCKGSIDPVIKTIELAHESTHIEVTTLLIDGENSSLEEMGRLAKRIAKIDPAIPLHISRYFPAYKMQIPATNIESVIEAGKIAKEYLEYVYIGNIWGVDNNTYCPNCYNKLIDRQNLGQITGVEQGNCKKCKYQINIKY